MISDHYRYIANQPNTIFFFRSEGQQGTIVKMIHFSRIKGNNWNLAFGDFKDGYIDDSIMSNNYDVMKIMRTVAQTTLVFLETYPKSRIRIKPVDEKRKRLYNIVFYRHYLEIKPFFKITGVRQKTREPYSPLKVYDQFTISNKFESWKK